MASHRWSILCHKASIDKDSNMLSLLDVTEEVKIFPAGDTEIRPESALVLNLQLMTMWDRSDHDLPEKAWTSISIELPNGQLFDQRIEAELDLTGSILRTRCKVMIEAIPFVGFGTYWFNVSLSPTASPGERFELVGRVPLEVKPRQVEPAPTEP